MGSHGSECEGFLGEPGRMILRPAGPGAWIVSRRGVAVALLLTGLTLVVFRLFPGLDIAASEAFYRGGNLFVAATPAGTALRRIFWALPFALLAAMVGLYGARRFGFGRAWAPSGRGILFLLVSLAVGPGLLVNVVLKDHSHRPRPVQSTAFGGALPFSPVGTFDGACRRNCSFVSGEGSSAFWSVAPALLVPAPMQPAALVGALCLGAAASLLRIAFGGHYLSDTIMAALLVWLVLAGTWRALMR